MKQDCGVIAQHPPSSFPNRLLTVEQMSSSRKLRVSGSEICPRCSISETAGPGSRTGTTGALSRRPGEVATIVLSRSEGGRGFIQFGCWSYASAGMRRGRQTILTVGLRMSDACWLPMEVTLS